MFTGAFDLAATPLGLGFERKFPTGLGGIAPNVDVVFSLPGGNVFAIESKISEPYGASKSRFHLKPKYFADASGLWAAAGLTGCQFVADRLRAGAHAHKVLDVAQLLKHMLGSARRGGAWHLCCLWYRVEGLAGDPHRRDLELFSQHRGRDPGRFSSMTYQSLSSRMTPSLGEEHAEWASYMARQYFGGCSQSR